MNQIWDDQDALAGILNAAHYLPRLLRHVIICFETWR